MTKEDIKARLINNDALFKNIYVFEQQFDIVPEDRKHYIVPTLSLLNQVVEDYHELLIQVGITDYIITSNLMVGESKAAHTIYVWTQEKAISGLSDHPSKGMPNKTILVIDEIQNIERATEENDVRAKILYDMIQELRHTANISQIIVSGPRIDNIATLGEVLFGTETTEIQSYLIFLSF